MNKQKYIENVLSLESNQNILGFKFRYNNQIMWPYIRFTLFTYLGYHINGVEYDSNPALSLEYLKKVSCKDKIRYIKDLCKGRKKHLCKKNIMFISSSVYNTEKFKGFWYNWLNDPYAVIFKDDTVILEKSYLFNFYNPRFFSNTTPYDDIFIISTFIKKLARVCYKDKKQIKNFIIFIKEHMKYQLDEKVYTQLENILLDTCKKLPFECFYWEKLLSKIQPKILFLDDGSYGSFAHIYNLAHKKGIVCGEFQHGFIDESHWAYNYNETIINSSEYKDCMPDYFLTFGEYWNSKNNSSTLPIVVGNPKINSTKFMGYKIESQGKKKIVFISNYVLVDFFIDTIMVLVKEFNALEKYDILIRPHPHDFNILEKYQAVSRETGITVIENETIQKTLSYSDAIISETTVAFEALCFDTKIFIRDTETSRNIFSNGFGCWFKNAKDLYKALEETNWREKNTVDPSYYFNADWERNYREFINRTLNEEQQEKLNTM